MAGVKGNTPLPVPAVVCAMLLLAAAADEDDGLLVLSPAETLRSKFDEDADDNDAFRTALADNPAGSAARNPPSLVVAELGEVSFTALALPPNCVKW